MPGLFFKGASLCKHACHTEGKACVLCLSRRLATKFLLSLSRHCVLSISKKKRKKKKSTWSSKTIVISFTLWVILPTNALFIYERKRENKQCRSLDESNPVNLKASRPGPRPNQPRKQGIHSRLVSCHKRNRSPMAETTSYVKKWNYCSRLINIIMTLGDSFPTSVLECHRGYRRLMCSWDKSRHSEYTCAATL